MPFHGKRTWVIHPAESAAWLARTFIGHSWCSCQGWSLGGYLFLNDQTSPDGAFELAIIKPPAEPGGQWWQVESVTFGWMQNRPFGRPAVEQARDLIEGLVAGAMDPDQAGNVAWKIDPPRVETPEQHGRCGHCA
jgi:hypothetical protein